VDPADELGARAHPRNALDPAPIDDPYDYNRDKRVDPGDELIARANQTSALNALKLINLSALAGTGFGDGGIELAESGKNPVALMPLGPTVQSREAKLPDTSEPTRGRLTVRLDFPGRIVLEMRGESGREFRLQVTDNPASARWQPVENRPMILADGVFQWNVSIPNRSARQFYRVVSSPE